MGFFAPDVQSAPKAAPKPRQSRQLDPNARGCEHCALKANWSWLTSPKLEPFGNTRDPDILVVGEIPSEREDKLGKAFDDDPGVFFRKQIPGVARDRCLFVHMVRCGNKAGKAGAADIHACSLHLEELFQRHRFKAILGVGSTPLAYFMKGQLLSSIQGTRFPVRIGDKLTWYYAVIDPQFVIEKGGDRSGAFPHLRADIRSFFREVDDWPKPRMLALDPADVLLPETREDAEEILAGMEGPLGVDLETTGLRAVHKDAEILTAAISDGFLTMAYPCRHPERPNDWGVPFTLEVIRRRRWIAHKADFELEWLLRATQRLGLDFEPAEFEDSMALGRVYHKRNSLLSLEVLSRIHLGIDVKDIIKVNRRRMIDEPLERILPYNGLDAQGSRLIFDEIYDKVEQSLYERLLGGIRSTAQMALLGLDTDPEVTKEQRIRWTAQRDKAKQEALQLYEVKAFERERQKEFDIDSSQHIGEALVEYGKVELPKTKKGEGKQWSTDETDLQLAAPDNPLIINTLKYREAQKQLSTYIEPIEAAHALMWDGRLHPQYTVLWVATGRLSSEDPNIQNFPKRKHRELRRQVVAPPGHILLSFDYGQLEARVFCFATLDRKLSASVIRDEDIHSVWRDRTLELHPPYWKVLEEKTNETEKKLVLKGGRDVIKTDFVFASFYGSMAKSVAKRTGMPDNVAEKMLGEFWREYAEVQAWGKARRREYQDTGDIRTLTGMVRHQIVWGNEPLNNPIQGTAAHIVLEAQNALSQMSRELKDPYLHPRINIHDDLTFIVPDDPVAIEEYVNIIWPELVKIRFPFQIVPLMVEGKLGYNWADLDEFAKFKGDYLR